MSGSNSSIEGLRARVYSVRQELSNIHMPPPPRSAVTPSDFMPVTPSDFMSCSRMVKTDSKGSNHFKSALNFVNVCD